MVQPPQHRRNQMVTIHPWNLLMGVVGLTVTVNIYIGRK